MLKNNIILYVQRICLYLTKTQNSNLIRDFVSFTFEEILDRASEILFENEIKEIEEVLENAISIDEYFSGGTYSGEHGEGEFWKIIYFPKIDLYLKIEGYWDSYDKTIIEKVFEVYTDEKEHKKWSKS